MYSKNMLLVKTPNKSLQLTRVTGRLLWQSLRAILPQKPPCNAVN
jgi:hypothetical protein